MSKKPCTNQQAENNDSETDDGKDLVSGVKGANLTQ